MTDYEHGDNAARAVYSGEAALEIAEFYLPDMFMSDVVMEGMMGIEAAVNLSMKRFCFSQVRRQPRPYRRKPEKHGRTFEILAKPVRPDDLIEKLRTYLSA